MKIVDEYEKIEEKGNLKIEKTLDKDNVTADDLENLKFTVQNEDGKYLYIENDVVKTSDEKKEISLGEFKEESGKYVLEFNDIPTGDYTVKETQSNIEGYELVYVKEGTTELQKDNDGAYEASTATVENGEDTTVEIVDKYELERGDLTIEKTLDKDNITDDDLENLKFTVKAGADNKEHAGEYLYIGTDGKVAYSADKVEIALKDFTKGTDGKYTLTFEDIVTGSYSVTETQSNIPGYELKSVKINGIDVTDNNAYSTNANVTTNGAEVKIVDEYEKIVEKADIEFVKVSESDTSEKLEGSKYALYIKVVKMQTVLQKFCD